MGIIKPQKIKCNKDPRGVRSPKGGQYKYRSRNSLRVEVTEDGKKVGSPIRTVTATVTLFRDLHEFKLCAVALFVEKRNPYTTCHSNKLKLLIYTQINTKKINRRW